MPNDPSLTANNDTEHQLTEQEAEKLFSEMSKAVAENNFSELDRLTGKEDAPVATADDNSSDKPDDNKPDDSANADQVSPNSEDQPTPESVAAGGDQDPKDLEIQSLRAELAKQKELEHKLRSDAGRVPAVQRQVSSMSKKLQKILNDPTTAAKTREQAQVLSDKLAQIREVDPLIADAVQETVANSMESLRQEQQQQLKQVVDAFDEQETEDLLDREYASLVAQVPNAPQVFAHPLWKEWKELVPAGMKSLAESAYADDVVVAFEQFSKFVLQRYPELAQRAPAVQDQQKPVATPATQQVIEDRNKKLKTAIPGSSAKPAEKVNDITDPDKLFSELWEQEISKHKRK